MASGVRGYNCQVDRAFTQSVEGWGGGFKLVVGSSQRLKNCHLFIPWLLLRPTTGQVDPVSV